MTEHHQCTSKCLAGQNKVHQMVHFVRDLYHQHICESSALDQKLHLNTGWEYSVNKTGPRTEPWGTPYTRGLGADTLLLTMTD